MIGLVRAPVMAAPTTAYLMVGGRCSNDCGFCAQARSSEAGDTQLARVSWPQFPADEVVRALAGARSAFVRVCIQATGTPVSHSAVLRLLRRLQETVALPVDVSALPPSVAAMHELFAAGVDHLGFGVDAATPEVFARVKGEGLERYSEGIAVAASTYPGRVAVHLIAGLGESERDMALAMQRYHDLGAVVGLFALCPVPGTRMERLSPPDLGSYRRLQVARYLIAEGLGRADGFAYRHDGRIEGFGGDVATHLADGAAFRTSGCPGCNRPFYNERPSGPMYNYPRPLTADEAIACLREAGLALPVVSRG